MALVLDDVTVRAGPAILIRSVSLAIRPGRLTAVLGPNGAGKSTALGALAGDHRPTAGSARLDGRPIDDIPRRALAMRRAVVRQHAPIHFPLLVHEVIGLARHPFGGGRSGSDVQAAQHAMAALDLTPLAGRNYATLSGGERQRVQIARALAQLWSETPRAPCYLLMDEPTAHLDLKHRIIALDVARRFAREGGGVLCILHDIGLARDFADEVILLRSGQIHAAGLPDEVLTPANLHAVFDVPPERARALA